MAKTVKELYPKEVMERMVEDYLKKDKRVVKPRQGPLPPVLGKGGPHKDRTKHTRKRKHKHETLDS